jgi:hypothetical protein
MENLTSFRFGTDGLQMSFVSNNSEMVDNSISYLCTQQAIKGYVDGRFVSASFAYSFSGACNAVNVTLYWTVVNGTHVIMTIPAFSATGASSATTIDSEAITAGIRPSVNRSTHCYVNDAGTHMAGFMLVRTTGVITIYRMQVSGSNVVYSNFSSNSTANGNGIAQSLTFIYKL